MAIVVPFESGPDRPPRHASDMVPGFLVSEQRIFFDPTDALRRKSNLDFLNAIGQSRHRGAVDGLGELSGYEVIMIESLHAGLDARIGEANYESASSLPIDNGRQRDILEWVQTNVDRTVNAITSTAQELRAEHDARRLAGVETLPLEPPLVLTSMAAAAAAHYGEKRRSGRDYYEHPREMSLSLEAAWHRMFGEFRLDERDRKMSAILLHDVNEKTIDPKLYDAVKASGRYVFGPHPLFTPLVIEKTAIKAGETFESARRLARINLAITRTRDVRGNKMPYRKVYLLHGVELAGADFEIDKMADFHHNRDLEPDPLGRPLMSRRKTQKKRADYDWGQETLMAAAQDEETDYDLPRLLRYIMATDQSELDGFKSKWAAFDHREAGRRVLAKLDVSV